LYSKKLDAFESKTLSSHLTKLAEYVNDKDYFEAKAISQLIKNEALLVGASHIYYIAETMEQSPTTSDPGNVITYYPTLLEACVTFKHYSRNFIALNKGS
jgi:hypothetical protein